MKYLFYIAKKYSIPVVSPLIDYLETTANHQYALFVSEKVKKQLAEDNLWQDRLIITSIDEGIKFQPDFCLSPGNYVDFRLPGIKVAIFHGIGIEKDSHYKVRHFFDVYCTSGPVVTHPYEKLRKKHGYFLVRETGWPKLDYIIKYPADNIRDKLGLPPSKKIILYAPTFSKKMQSADMLLENYPAIIKDDELWLIKFHELMDKNIVEKIKKNPEVVLLETYDITPYLYASDLLISDTSSVIYEFMVLDKPIITINTKSRKDKGINISDPDELRDAIDRAFANPEEHSANRKKHLSEVNPYLDGDISKSLIQTLEKIKTNNELPKKKKPLNIYRKLRILYHEKYKKGYLK